MRAADILRWDNRQFQAFLDRGTPEGDAIEYKERIEPHKGSAIRKAFSAFANATGGFIFFGIRDTDRAIVGIDCGANEFLENISNCLDCDRLRPSVKYSVLKQFRFGTKLVIVYLIQPGLDSDRPHMADDCIYVREGNRSRPIQSGDELRRRFFSSRFVPEHLEQVSYWITRIEQDDFTLAGIDVQYLLNARRYLEDKCLTLRDERFISLRNRFNAIGKALDRIATLRAAIHVAHGAPSFDRPHELVQECTYVKQEIESFLTEYKVIHQ
ncbi:MAG: ATP-binding protein [Elusimicrobiota bacterium]|jgi:hypothetical protein